MEAKILVIDDEENIRFTFERLLQGAGYGVETAANLEEGLAQIGANGFDLVFADILLGGQSGIDILREIRQRDLSCPVVFITGYPNFETASEAVRLGAFDYLPKPVLKEALLKVAGLAVACKKSRDDSERYRSNLEAIFGSVQDAIITVAGDLTLVEFNRAAKDLCGLAPEAIGKRFDPSCSGCRGDCLSGLKQAIALKKTITIQRFECRSACHAERVSSLTASPLLDHGDAFSGAVMVVRDETRLAGLARDMKERRRFHRMVGGSGKMQAIYSLVEDLANVKTSVLITGESGTGKELLAEAIHYAGERSDKPLVKVNCSALSENLLESELFGHVRGSFTGAVRDKVGRFRMADGGSILLDEIGDISPGIQQRLLRVLQEREFEQVGSSKPIQVDVRVIAATNKDLLKKTKQGEFREDLYYRLKVVEITIPPLRDRREDIPLLVAHYVAALNKKLSKRIEGVSKDVLSMLMEHPWPGNVRQLAHTLEHAFIVCRQNIITIDHLPSDFMSAAPAYPAADDGDESVMILGALAKTAGNKARAARLLGMSRRTLYRKIEQHGIENSHSCP